MAFLRQFQSDAATLIEGQFDQIHALRRELASLRDDLHAVHAQLTAQVLAQTSDDDSATARIAAWEEAEAVVVPRATATLEEPHSVRTHDLLLHHSHHNLIGVVPSVLAAACAIAATESASVIASNSGCGRRMCMRSYPGETIIQEDGRGI